MYTFVIWLNILGTLKSDSNSYYSSLSESESEDTLGEPVPLVTLMLALTNEPVCLPALYIESTKSKATSDEK